MLFIKVHFTVYIAKSFRFLQSVLITEAMISFSFLLEGIDDLIDWMLLRMTTPSSMAASRFKYNT